MWYALSSLVKRFHKVKYLNKFCYTYSLLELNACYLKINQAKFIPHLDSPFGAVKENTHLHNKALSVEVRKLQCTHTHTPIQNLHVTNELYCRKCESSGVVLFILYFTGLRMFENYAERNMTLIIVLTIVDIHFVVYKEITLSNLSK